MESLAKIAMFRRYYWNEDGIRDLSQFHGNDILLEIQFLAGFLYEMKTSLALPILARYWNENRPSSNESGFLQVLKALVAFLVIRRAATGSTATIDSDFRSIMEEPRSNGGESSSKLGLCVGIMENKPALLIDDLKEGLKSFLLKKLGTLSQDRWVDRVIENPLYDQSRPLTKFMLLSAAHQSLPTNDGSGTWIRESVRESHERNFFCRSIWKESNYETVEHIAPKSMNDGDWKEDLSSENLRSTLGNLILLPGKENLIASNHSWKMKNLLYKAFTAETEEELASIIETAKNTGNHFPEKTIKVLRKGKQLPILEPLKDVGEWSADIVKGRSRNIAMLTWDIVRPWLD